MTIALMMVTYNRLNLTKDTIMCILKNTHYLFDLCIVDNGSSDGTVEWIDNELSKLVAEDDNYCRSLLVKKNSKNLGIAIGRNQGLILGDKTGAMWMATVDNDVWLPEWWATQAIDILKSNRQFGSIGVNMEGRSYPIVEANGCRFQEKPQGNLGTACMVFNKSLHNMLGFFNDRDYAYYAHEDADWGMRTRVLGLKLGYIENMGKHIGEGENDQGEYREFKNIWHGKNLPMFHKNAREYMRKEKSCYIPFKESTDE